MKWVLLRVSVVNKDKEMKQDMWQILAVTLILLALSHHVVLFRCLQRMNKIYKIFVFLFLHKSDVFKLKSFSTKNLFQVNCVTCA